jgi:hypothetical protein
VVGGRIQHPQPQCRESGQQFLGARHLHCIQVILDAQCGEEVALDIELAAEVGIGQCQRITSEHCRPDGLGGA